MSTPIATMPPRPTPEEIVDQKVLISREMTVLSLARGFGGYTNPTTIWERMITDDPVAFQIYRELEEKDEDIGGAIEELKLSVLSRECSVIPKAGDESQFALDIATFIEQQLAAVPNFHSVKDALLDAAPYGVAIAEILYDVSAGQVGLIDIKDRPQDLFAFGKYLEPQIGQLRFKKNVTDINAGEPVPEEKFIVFSYRPRNGNRRGRPLLRQVFWPSWFKRQDLRFWLRFAEKGPGTAVVRYKSGATNSEKQEALAAAEAFIDQVAVAVPENMQIIEELLTAARSQDPKVYAELHDRLEAKIARRIVGQTLTSHGSDQGKGTQALGEVHADTKFQKTVELARGLEAAINQCLVRPLVLWNFGPNAPMPTWQIDKSDEEDQAQAIQVDDKAQQMGMEIPKSYMRKKYGIPEVKSGDEALVRTKSTAPATVPPDQADKQPGYTMSETQRKELADMNRLLANLRNEAIGDFEGRVKEVAEQLRIQGGVR